MLKERGMDRLVWIIVGLISALGGFIQTVTGFGGVVTMMLVLQGLYTLPNSSASVQSSVYNGLILSEAFTREPRTLISKG